MSAQIKKVVFLTVHSWVSNRQGGFHKFAEACCTAGAEVVFFSFPRPYYSLFQHQELYNRKSIAALSKGIRYEVGGSTLTNVTLPTLKLPDAVGKLLPDVLADALERFSFGGLGRFADRYFSGTDVFVIESCGAVGLFDFLKKRFPQAKFVYRPSDPLMYDGALERRAKAEEHVMLGADMTLVVNDEGLALYRRKIPQFDTRVRHAVLPNGVDIAPYRARHDVPDPLKKSHTVLYVGAWEVEWALLFEAAARRRDFNYIVVCPNFPDEKIRRRVGDIPNLTYIPGIRPEEVPAWITNCDVVMVPYVTDFYKNRPLGITAKYYQAMAAGKPIVAYCDTPKLAEVGVPVTYGYEDFMRAVEDAMERHEAQYTFDLSDREWPRITQRFLEILREL